MPAPGRRAARSTPGVAGARFPECFANGTGVRKTRGCIPWMYDPGPSRGPALFLRGGSNSLPNRHPRDSAALMALPNKAKIPVGTILAGKYRITREIGRGGMAAVYEAENVDIGKRVAIKVLAQELTTSAVVVERFLREARAAAAIRSPFICDVYDSGRLEDGRPFLVLELLEGESLYERMTVVRCLDLETTVTVVSQVCRGLAKAHSASIVHRDLKPENIFLTRDEEGQLLAKILDFGLAKFYAPMNGGDKQARLTREGAVFGTPAYMSPEQVRGQGAVDHRADLWALGCITFECLTGRTVWQTDQGVAMTFAQIANAPLPRPSEFRPDLPASFTTWFDRALDRTIERRFQTAKEFSEELSVALGVAPQGPRAAEPSFVAPVPDDIEVEFGNAETPLAGAVFGGSASAPAGLPLPPARISAPEVAGRPSPPGTSKLAFAAPQVAPMGGARQAPETTPAGGGHGGAALAQDKRSGGGRGVLLFGVLILLAGAGYAGYRQFLQPTGPTPVAPSSTAVSPTATPSADSTAVRETMPLTSELPWAQIVAQAQEVIAAGDLKEGQRLLKEAYDKGGHGVPRTMHEHLLVAVKEANGKTPCQLTGLGRPRTYDLTARGARVVPGSRPSIALGPRGPVITWTDAHEGSEHAYAAALDGAMRAARAVDVTPEGSAVARPDLRAVGERLLLSYWDAKGPEAGVHARWLNADGRIQSPAASVASIPRGGNFWPSLTTVEGGFFVVWSEEGDASSDSEDLFLRRLSANLEPVGDPVQLTDIAPAGPVRPRARYPSVAAHGDALHIAYRLEREPQHLIQHMRLPIADAAKGVAPAGRGERVDRTAGEVALVNTDRMRSDGPGIACGAGGCFLVWHGDAPASGASAAYIDPATAQPLWRKRFARYGMDPAVAVAPDGQARLFWYEGGRFATASINRDGIGVTTRFARVSGDQPMPSVAAGAKPGEWYVAWLDYEAGHLEPYAARLLCR